MATTRPPLTTRQTTITDLSTSFFQLSDRTSNPSTAFTSPDLLSLEGKGPQHGKLDSMLEVFEGFDDPPTKRMRPGTPSDLPSPRRGAVELGGAGPSVKERASVFERSGETKTSPASTRRPLASPVHKMRSSSTLRVDRSHASSSRAITPTKLRRVPVPSTEANHRVGHLYLEPGENSPTAQRPTLQRGSGLANKMIQQWENLPVESPKRLLFSVGRTPSRQMSREYLDSKPLPVPGTNPVPSSSYRSNRPSPSRASPYSPPRHLRSPSRTHLPSPLPQRYLQTPTAIRERGRTLSSSPSSYEVTPSHSGDKKQKGKSPLKDMLNMFGGGIKEIGRKAKGNSKERFGGRSSPIRRMTTEDQWESGVPRVGTNGIPGGLVFSDRMGNQEMDRRGGEDPNVRRPCWKAGF